MKILVTGGAGFVGTNLLIELSRNKSYKLFSIDNYCIGLKENHIEDVNYISDDVNNIFEYDEKYDIIYHLAALSRIQPSFDNPELTYIYNTTGTLKVLEYARKNKSKVIYSGSSSKHHNPMISPYAMTKFLGEELCKLYKESYDLEIQIVRFYNVYGPYEIMEGDWAAVIGKWRNSIKKGIPLEIVGDGNQRRDFTHVNDIVSGLIKISKSNSINFEWELGSGKNYSINEVYKMFEKKFSCKVKYIENQPGNYKETLRKNDIAIEELGWTPEFELEKYIQNL
jgi:UDP-glucose 4-epimerase